MFTALPTSEEVAVASASAHLRALLLCLPLAFAPAHAVAGQSLMPWVTTADHRAACANLCHLARPASPGAAAGACLRPRLPRRRGPCRPPARRGAGGSLLSSRASSPLPVLCRAACGQLLHSRGRATAFPWTVSSTLLQTRGPTTHSHGTTVELWLRLNRARINVRQTVSKYFVPTVVLGFRLCS